MIGTTTRTPPHPSASASIRHRLTVMVAATAMMTAMGVALMAIRSHAIAQPPVPQAVERVELGVIERVGQMTVERTNRRLELTYAIGQNRAVRTEAVAKIVQSVVLDVGADRRADKLQISLDRLRREVEAEGKTTEAADPREGQTFVLIGRDAVETFRGADYFLPVPPEPVAVGESWTVGGGLALRHIRSDAQFERATIRLTLVAVERAAEGVRVARVRRVSEAVGTSDGTEIRETDTGDWLIDIDNRWPLAIVSQAEIQVSRGGATVAVGTRTVVSRFTHRQVPTWRIAPRAEVGVTQTERSESIADVVIAATRPSQPDRSTALHRHIENLSVTRRQPLAVTATGELQRLRVEFLTAQQLTVVRHPEGRDMQSSTDLLEGATIELHIDPATGHRRVADRPALRAHVANQLAARNAKAQSAPPTAGEIDRATVQLAQQLSATRERLSDMALPTQPIPIGYSWALPPQMAAEAFSGVLKGVTPTEISATATLFSVTEFAGRPTVAHLHTRLVIKGADASGVAIEADLSNITFFDIDAGRPLAVRSEGQLTLHKSTPDATIEGRGTISGQTTFVYDRGPNMRDPAAESRRELAGRWVWIGADGRPDARYVLELVDDGRMQFTSPNLSTGEPVKKSGRWDVVVSAPDAPANTPPTLRLALDGDLPDEFRLVRTADQLTLTKTSNSRHTGIFPLLPNQSAHYRR